MAKIITADIISDFFIQKSIEVDNPAGGNITHNKLQKLVTYSYVWYLGLRRKKLFEEKIKAGRHGYFVESQFERFKPFGFMPIVLPDFECNIESKLSVNIYDFLDNLWDAYGCFEGAFLSKLQYRDMPYKESFGFSFFVNDDRIEEFYSYRNKEIERYLPDGVYLFPHEENYQYCIGYMPLRVYQ